MKQHLREVDSKRANIDNLLVFFTGWGCDQYQFGHLNFNGDILFLYDYCDLELDFDFSKYKTITTLAYSAGVFISSIFPQEIPNVVKRVIIDGNPYLFDEKFGVSSKVVKIFKEVDEKNCLDFRKDYLVATHEEMKRFAQNEPKRGFDDCLNELLHLEKLYRTHKSNINLKYDKAIFGEFDPIFKVDAQKEFFNNNITLVHGAKHNIFFRFNSFEEILDINWQFFS